MSIFHVIHETSRAYMTFFVGHMNNIVFPLVYSNLIYFFSLRRVDFTASGLLRRIRGGIPQLHPTRLPSAVSPARELSR